MTPDESRELVLTELLARRAAEHPDRPFLQDRDAVPRSYAEVDDEVRRIAGGLRSLGIGRDDTVLVLLPNGLDVLRTWFALSALGAVEVPVNVFLRGAFLEHVLEDSRARVLVAHPDLLGPLAEVELPERLTTLVVADDGEVPSALAGLARADLDELRAHEPVDAYAAVGRGDVNAIYYTSGTTGPAKGIMSTYGQGMVNSRNYLAAVEAREDDVFFCCMPLFHSNAQVLQVAAPLMVGGRVSVWPEFSASRWLDQVRSVGATVSNTLGVMLEFLHRRDPRPDDADNPLRVLQTIPAPVGIAASVEQRFGVRCVDGYGLTDVGMLAFRGPGDPLVPGSSGRPVEDFEVVVADPETDEVLPPGTPGEVLVRPKVPFGFQRGYWNRPDETLRAWRNLWFHTGDCAVVDDDGLLWFVDRMGDSVRVRGENVSSAEIEGVLSAHPSVRQCAAVGVPSDVGDHDVLAVVVAADGALVDAEELVRWCEGRMPYYAVPRYVEVLDELPMTPTHKVRKVELRSRGVTMTTWDRVAAGVVVSRA